MTIKLSKTSKMPCKSWSTPALSSCNRGNKLAKNPNSICHSCYACKGMYRFPVVQSAREENISSYLENPAKWTSEMEKAIGKAKYFRWFDSGDLHSVSMLNYINIIALNLPHCNFWLPTREINIVKTFFDSCPIVAPNLNIRISADFIGAESLLKVQREMSYLPVTFSGVVKEIGLINKATLCMATFDHEGTGGKCGDCRKCWDKEQTFVVYKKH